MWREQLPIHSYPKKNPAATVQIPAYIIYIPFWGWPDLMNYDEGQRERLTIERSSVPLASESTPFSDFY